MAAPTLMRGASSSLYKSLCKRPSWLSVLLRLEGRSRMRREFHVRFWEGGGVRFPSATRLVVGFQHKRDAERYLRDVRERLARFGLRLHPDKTRLVEFGRFAVMNRRQRGVGKPETFDFLGFTHYCTTTRRGRFRLGRKPVAKRVNWTRAGGWGGSAKAGSTTLPSRGRAGSSVHSTAGCNACGYGRCAGGPNETASVGGVWSA